MEWTKAAEEKMQEILVAIPAMVRDMAEYSARNKAEEKAEDRDSNIVEIDDAIAGFIVATPFNMRRFIKPTLTKAGVDLAKFTHLLP